MTRFTRDQAASYLAGLIDGEGSVSRIDGGRKSRVVQIANTDESLIAAAGECLEILGVTYKVYSHKNPKAKDHWAPKFTLMIQGKANIGLLSAWVTLRSPAKAERLRLMLSDGWVTVRRPHVHTLQNDYGSGMCLKQMGDKYGVSTSTVRKWMVDLGLPRRSSGGGKAASAARWGRKVATNG